MTTRQIRLAFRVEGSMWNCYMAQMETMEGAVLLGSVRKEAVRTDETKDTFKHAMMRIFEKFSPFPTESWEEKLAPEHERGGNV